MVKGSDETMFEKLLWVVHMEFNMAVLISSRIQVHPISGFDTRTTVEGTSKQQCIVD